MHLAKYYEAHKEIEDPRKIAQFEKLYEELLEKRKIFTYVEKMKTKDIYSFDLQIPKAFDSIQVNNFLTHQIAEINGEFVDVGIGKPAEKGKIIEINSNFNYLNNSANI